MKLQGAGQSPSAQEGHLPGAINAVRMAPWVNMSAIRWGRGVGCFGGHGTGLKFCAGQ